MAGTGVNYIKHLQAISIMFYEDDRLNPWHISLYYGLFHIWNGAMFQNPVSISRSELMTVSKIGSANTYTKCLKQLDEWGYIRYLPSHNPMKGSHVNLYTFDKSSDKTPDKTGDSTRDHAPVNVVRPYINNTNKKKQIKHTNSVNDDLEIVKDENRKKRFSPPKADEVKDFFVELKSNPEEAEKFHNHFESNGWLVGGKAKMKDWQAAARNWIKRAKQYSGTSSKQNHLHVDQNKDYNIPL